MASRNEKLYDEYKACVPCITPNFLYRNTHEDINIIRPTGLLYIDIDPKKGQPFDFDPKILDKSKIYSYFKTFSGIGYGILVKVEGLTKENFKDTFHAICQDLGISQYFDKNARKASQYLALSYDPDVYFNPDSFLFSSVTKTAPLLL